MYFVNLLIRLCNFLFNVFVEEHVPVSKPSVRWEYREAEIEFVKPTPTHFVNTTIRPTRIKPSEPEPIPIQNDEVDLKAEFRVWKANMEEYTRVREILYKAS